MTIVSEYEDGGQPAWSNEATPSHEPDVSLAALHL